MIEDEELFKNYLIYKKSRKLTAEAANSYIDDLNSIKKEINVDITRDQFSHIEEVKSILYVLKTRMSDSSIRNCQSALRAYFWFNRSSSKESVYPEEIVTYTEGMVTNIKVNKYERDINARLACIDYHKAICKVCNFNFSLIYGAIGEGFIHVHHLVPLAQVGKQYIVNPIIDLVPVCPNCHAMLHRKTPPFTIKELISIISV
ncbi:HNH endonuclease [Shewanella frigidimarina]|uniref:HNH endonuclease n=1 Tax=Shewanella frigidimarina TaxID=56812 RepID=UPI001FDF7D21|nr:HNH endonuclease [Shewanella frigidimarina]